MFDLATRMKTIKPSPTFALAAEASRLKQQGVDIISLSMGEPDFAPPSWVQDAVMDSMKKGLTKYTPSAGIPALTAAIQAKFERDYDLEYPSNMITVGAGTKQLIFNAFLASINPGDEVIIPAPYWVSYPDIVTFCGGVPVFADGNPNNHFKMDADELRFRITDRTRWVILNSPNNPSGSVYSKEELRALGNVLMDHLHVNILCDDIYEPLVFDDAAFASLARVEPRLKFRTLICNGVSKAYAMTGFRLGYAAGPVDLIKAMDLLQSQSTSNVCSLSQGAAIAALNGPQDFIKDWNKVYDERRHFVHKAINKIPGLKADLPQGAFYVFVNCHDLLEKRTPDGMRIRTDDDLCQYFIKDANVMVVGGGAFGISPYFRISYATSMENLEKGCQRIAEAVSKLVD